MKQKIVILMPVHCAPKVAMMTLGTWLESMDESYTVEIIIGVHENYHHYHQELDSLKQLPVHMTTVKEINWISNDIKQHLIRYSKMHAINLQAMLEYAQTLQFDHLAILDHDLMFHTDFIGWAIQQQADLIGNFMDDRTQNVTLPTLMGFLNFVPKFSIWHLVMSKPFYDKIMENLNLIYPIIQNEHFYDTFSRIIETNTLQWNMPVEILSTSQMNQMVKHLWSMSFNMGHASGNNDYNQRLQQLEQEYDQRFPNGIQHLFKKIQA